VRNNPAGLTVGAAVTMADMALFEIVDLHIRIFAEEMAATVRPWRQMTHIPTWECASA
jgi:hypothetical protein